MADASPPSPSSPRAKKRHRQRTNQQKKVHAQDALVTLRENPTFGNAFRAWLAAAEEELPPQEYKSANKFTRALRAISSRSSDELDYAETRRISANTLVRWIDDLAWSLNVKFMMSDNIDGLRTPTSRIGRNFRCFLQFLSEAGLFSPSDIRYLFEECAVLEHDLDRTARVNRIMEEYTWYVQEAYFDSGRIVDETYDGEYEVESVSARRVLILRRYESEESDSTSSSLRSFRTYFPTPLVNLVKRGDTLTLQICHLQENNVWVPYRYSGFTPTRDDGGSATPTERQIRTSTGLRADDPIHNLQSSLARLDISSRAGALRAPVGSRSSSTRRSRTPQRHASAPAQTALTPHDNLDFHFNESKFSEDYFRSWEGDIDSDEDFADIVHPPDCDDNTDARGRGSSGVNLFQTLRERHS